ncbi:MAG: SurA N-terminal domain-containing protein [Candidatus Daviesbacteria bacterium]|nr:SurA N-terminal domain-containing protein [Candidatus Daviesbacteria bacterium]
MPRATTKKPVVKKTTSIDSTPVYSQISQNLPGPLKNLKLNKFIIIAIVIIAIALLFTYKKNWIVAASVNGAPISNFEVLSRLNNQYRTQILNQMINEKIILNEAQKQNVLVIPTEVADKIAVLEKSVGGKEALDGLLAQQGQTRVGLQDQIKIQLIIEKLYANEATVSASEVAQFIAQNGSQLQATDSAGQQKEAEDALKQQKLGTILNQKFQQLKSSAKVTIY